MEQWIRDLIDRGMIRSGMSISAIARKSGMSRITVKKHLMERKTSSYLWKKISSILVPYKEYIA